MKNQPASKPKKANPAKEAKTSSTTPKQNNKQ